MIIPANAEKIIKLLKINAHDAYVVGGCVRDTLIGRPVNDWDITTSAKPEEIKRIFRRTVDTGIEHGTVTVLFGDEAYEVTTYRIDGDYSDRRHPDRVTFTTDLKEDLLRRDFTINAMAYNHETGIVDVYGGMKDLEAGLIRCVGAADERFTEDALRILRAVRFAAQLGFEIEKETYAGIRDHGKDLEAVSEERIFAELNKILTSPNPGFIKMIFDCNADKYICGHFPLTGRKAAEDMQDITGDFASKLHMRWTYLMKELDPETASVILRELKSDNDTVKKTTALVKEYRQELPGDETAMRRLLRRIGPSLTEDLLELKKASPECRKMLTDILERGDAYELKMLAVTGGDLIKAGYRSGPGMGEILEGLLNTVIEDPSKNTKEILLKEIH